VTSGMLPDEAPGGRTLREHARPYALATLLGRENRFVVSVRLGSGEVTRAYLPNTARLHDLLRSDASVVLEATDDPRRTTRYTATRVTDRGAWVSLEAARASDHVATHVCGTGGLPGIDEVLEVEREVRVGAHRFDFLLRTPAGDEVIFEVKSLSRAVGSDAPLSATPSIRGVAHLKALADLVREGGRAAVAFVVQRGDVDRLVVGHHADPAWVAAVREAHGAGVAIIAFRCHVDPTTVALDRAIPVVYSGS
jgi:sugar fermentation stimulation protein A